MKIAKFQAIGNPSWITVFESRSDGSDPCPDSYVRISEYVDIDFPPRAPEEIVPAQLAALDKAEQDLRAQFQLKLNEIADARARVRSLTHEVAA